MSLQATRWNTNEVTRDKSGKVVVVDRRKANARPKRADNAEPGPSSDGGPSDANARPRRENKHEDKPDSDGVPSHGSKPAGGGEKVKLDWQQMHILTLFVSGFQNVFLKMTEYLMNEYDVDIELITDSDVDEDGKRKVTEMVADLVSLKARTIIPEKRVSPSFFAGASEFEFKWLAFVIESFGKDDDEIRQINSGFYDKMKPKDLSELDEAKIQLRQERLDCIKRIMADTAFDDKKSENLFKMMKKIFILQFLIASRKNAQRQQKKPPPAGVASDLPRELTERMSELLQTPILYEAWMKETHRSVHPIDDNGRAI